MQFHLSVVFCIFSSVFTMAPSHTSNTEKVEEVWEFKKESEGIKVYYRESKASNVKELKITFNVDASLNTMMAVLKDIPAFTEWIYKCEEPRFIKKVSDKEIYYYNKINFPWPLSDRDAIAKSTVSQDPATKVIRTHNVAIPDLEPENKGVVRIQNLDIQWIITPIDATTSHVDYFLLADPGGSLPKWLINMAIEKGPLKSMKAFREMVKKEKYQGIKIEGIMDF